jgi:tartrate-resistant acid phosphatase type 5
LEKLKNVTFFSSRLLQLAFSLVVLGLLIARPVVAQRFAALGDFGYASKSEQDVAKLIDSWKPDFIITLGDNNYDLGEGRTIDANIGQYYQAYIGKYTGKYGSGSSVNRFFPSIGNHDLYTASGQAYLNYFTLPGNERYYDFVKGNVHFFVLNSDPLEPDGITSTSVQAQWLQQQMSQSTASWKVVYFHHAPYSSGHHGSTREMQWPFRAWGASVVISGHDHHYERILADGIPYFVNGLGGRSIYTPYTPVANSQVLYSANYGAMLIQASADSIYFQFINRDKVVIDTYTLHRVAPPAATLDLLMVYPNPMSENAQVEFTQGAVGPTVVRVIDAYGREVSRLYDGLLAAGRQSITWERGTLASGIYQVQVISGATARTTRVLVL